MKVEQKVIYPKLSHILICKALGVRFSPALVTNHYANDRVERFFVEGKQ